MTPPSPPAPARLITALLDLIYPRQCGGCGGLGTWLCPRCLDQMAPPARPGWVCARCARPLLPAPTGLYCPDLCDTGGLTAVLCSGLFAGPLREAIHHLKYSRWRVLAAPLAALLAATCRATPLPWAESVVPWLLPVPLHPRRQRARGFNQAALLAASLAARLGWPLLPGLTRVRFTDSQVGLSAAERAVNLEDAFAWRGAPLPRAPLVLVDDVYTTGVTMSLCAEVLRARGAGPVYGLALARTEHSDQHEF
ncbi:MAG TPA: double zinc ribbon domain-containing protein [Chloroflexia bacterium]|nr:double zinc ribbon domain-containing protein [Chloroflexia bacterium]